MSLRLVVLQPGYLPWAGYFDQLRQADVFVHYDDVQYDKHGWRNRNRIRVPIQGEGDEGWAWLTVPVRIAGQFGAPIDQVEIDQRTRWADKHWGTLLQHYRKAAHWKAWAGRLEAIYRRSWRLLVDLDLALIELLAEGFGLGEKQTVRSSQLPVPPGDDPTDRLLRLCRHFGADQYFSGAAARDYLDVERFAREGIEVEFQAFAHPTYDQVYPGFVSHLSALDLLLNAGPASGELLRSGSPAR